MDDVVDQENYEKDVDAYDLFFLALRYVSLINGGENHGQSHQACEGQ